MAKPKTSPTKSKPGTTAVTGGGDQPLIRTESQERLLNLKPEEIYVRVKYNKSTFIVFTNIKDKISELHAKIIECINPFKQPSFEYKPHIATGYSPYKAPVHLEDIRLFQYASYKPLTGAVRLAANAAVPLKEMDHILFQYGITNDSILFLAFKEGDKYSPIDVPPFEPIEV